MLILVVCICSIGVVILDYLHDKWNKGIDEDVSAGSVVTPYFEQVEEFVCQGPLTVVVSEELEQLRSNLRCHLSHNLLI